MKFYISHLDHSPAEEMILQTKYGLDPKDVPSVEEVIDLIVIHQYSNMKDLAYSIIDLFTDTES